MILNLLNTYTQTNREPLYLTPILEDAKGWDLFTLEQETRTIYTPRDLMELEENKTFYLSRVLTEDIEDMGITFLLLDSYRPCSIFLDGALLYTTCPQQKQEIGQVIFPVEYIGISKRGEAIRCTLPAGFTGKTLTIATVQPKTEYGPSMPSIRLSSQAIETELWMNTANHNIMPAITFVVIALLLFGLLCYSLYHDKQEWSLLLLTMAAFSQFFYYLREYSFSSPAFTALDTPLAAFLPVFIIVLPELFLVLKMRRWRKYCAVFILLSAILALIPPIANFSGTPQLNITSFTETLYIGMLALLVCTILEARDKNLVFQLFLYGFGLICMSILVVCASSLTGNHFYMNYIASVVWQVINHFPTLFQYWFGTLLLLLASTISMYLVIYEITNTQTKLAVQLERSDRLDYELATQKQFYEAKLSNEEALRALRHDMKGHLLILSALLTDHKIEEAMHYLSDVTKLHQEWPNKIYCENPFINAILKTYDVRFQKHNITFICRIGLDRQVLPNIELCLILNNALENALEASLLLPEKDRSVKVQATVQKNQFLLRISNRFDGILQKNEDLPPTIKSEKGHGYGLSNIRCTAERMGGELHYHIERGYFVLDVHFPLSENRNSNLAG